MDPLPIGIVGLNFGRHILESIDDGPAGAHVRLAAVCDLDREKAQAFAAQYNVPAFFDLDDLLRAADIPAVGLFTGPAGRAGLIRRCVDAGKHVMTTKPFELDPEAGLAALAHARSRGMAVHLNSPTPRLPADLRTIRDWQTRYDLGRPAGARADIWASYHEAASGNWQDDPARCPVAPIFRIGIYLINDLIALLGAPEDVAVLSSRIRTGRPTPDNGQLGIRFANGALANVYASFCVEDGDHYRSGLTINYERGTVYRNVGPDRAAAETELALVMQRDGERACVERCTLDHHPGAYDWATFVRAARGEDIAPDRDDADIVGGVRVIRMMMDAAAG